MWHRRCSDEWWQPVFRACWHHWLSRSRSWGSQTYFQIAPKRDAEALGRDRPVLWLSVGVLMQTEVLCKKGRREVVLVSRFLQKVRLSQAAWHLFFQLYISLGTGFLFQTALKKFSFIWLFFFLWTEMVKRGSYDISGHAWKGCFFLSVQFYDEQWLSWSWILFRTSLVEWLSTLSQNSGASWLVWCPRREKT